MSRVPEISEIEVQTWVGDKSFQRGYRYFEDETILNPRRRGESLIAECQGTQPAPYRVEIRLGADGILGGNCSCPAGEGGHCKHAAALLLTWLHEPNLFTEVPELEKLLENRSTAELISLVQQMVTRHPDLEQLLELSALANIAPGEPLSADLIAQQVRRAFSSAGGETAGDNAQIADNLQPILDLGEDLLDREDVSNASIVYNTLIETMLVYEDCLYKDEGGDLGQMLAECEQGIEECLQHTQDPEIRRGLLNTLFELFMWDLRAGGLGFADETPSILTTQSNPREKQEIASWVQAELPDSGEWNEHYQRRTLGGLWLDLMAGEMDDETYLHICRETGRTHDLINRLLSLQRTEEAVEVAHNLGSYEITAIADLFEAHGLPETAKNLIQELPNHETDVHMLGWLTKHAVTHGQPQEALRLSELLFWSVQSLENYNILLESARNMGQRDPVRERVLERLESAGNFSLLVEIYLLENEVDLALAALEQVNPDIWWGRMAVLRQQVAHAVEVPRPHEAIRQYLLLVGELIDQRSRGSYAEAARLLLQVRKLYRGLGEEERWQEIITSLRLEYRRLPALLDELRRAGI
jgi:tetratricopeptide (TPR) repeat protein